MKHDVWVDLEQRKPEPYQKIFMITKHGVPEIEVGYYIPGDSWCWVFIDGVGETECQRCGELIGGTILQNAMQSSSVGKWADYDEIMNTFK